VESLVTDGDPVIPRVFLSVGIDSNNNVLFRDLTESDEHFFVQELVTPQNFWICPGAITGPSLPDLVGTTF
jgi:hypothetical protein